MSEWITTTLGALCAAGGGSIQTGPFGSQLHAEDYVTDGTPSVMPQNIGDNVIDTTGIARVSDADLSRLSKYKLGVGDIVYSRRGDVEKRALVRHENQGWLCGTGCLRVRLGPDSHHDPKFISYLLGEPRIRTWIRRHAVGATMPNLNTTILGDVPLRVPSPRVQVAIAEVLGALDDKIAANAKLVELAGQLSLALVASHQASVPLSEIAKLTKRTLMPDAFGARPVAHFSLPAYDDGQLPVLTEPSKIKSAKVAIDSPSVLVSKLNPRFPRIWDVPILPSGGPSLASTEFLVLHSEHASSSLLWAILSQPSFSQELQGMAAGTSGSHQRVKPDALMASHVIDPRRVSGRTHETVRSLGEAIHFRRQESRALTVLRDALLPQLMSGKIRVKDAERAVSEAV